MKIIKSFNHFSKEASVMEEYIAFMGIDRINEASFIDNIKNSLSKSLLGSLSYVKMIDDLYDKVLSLEKEKLDKEYDFDDAIDSIEEKIDSVGNTPNSSTVKDLIKQRERKLKEMEAYMDSQNLKIKQGKELIEKVIKGNPRRSEYAKTKASESNSNLADYRYEVAKKKSESPEDLKDIKLSAEKAKEKAEDKASIFQDRLEKRDQKEKKNAEIKAIEIPSTPLIKSEDEKKIINSRDPKDLIERKENLEIEIAKMRASIERALDAISSVDGPIEKKYIESRKVKLIELSNSFDSSVNLLKLYREMGKTKDSVSKKLGNESTFTELSNKINTSIADGNDANSGVTKYLMDLFNNSDSDNLSANAEGVKEKLFKNEK